MLGFEASSQTAQNLLRTGEIVINLVDEKQVDVVNRLSMLTGTTLCPKESRSAATRFDQGKFGAAG
jgi:flavin reductase (DIM6/NTAB) family NADH-FMN oxidoreductase RutF